MRFHVNQLSVRDRPDTLDGIRPVYACATKLCEAAQHASSVIDEQHPRHTTDPKTHRTAAAGLMVVAGAGWNAKPGAEPFGLHAHLADRPVRRALHEGALQALLLGC